MKSAIRLLIVIALGAGALFLPANAAPKATCDLTAGDYIVSFKGSVNVSNELKNVHGRQVTPKFQYSRALNGFSGTLSADEACELQSNPRVDAIELNGIVTADGIQNPAPSWGLDRVDEKLIDKVSSYSYSEFNSSQVNNVKAYVIDTGILKSHTDFGTRVILGTDVITPKVASGDCNGHGTHVAGTIGGSTYGIAKQIKLVAVRVLDCTGSGAIDGVIAGIDWVIGDHVEGQLAIANMSLGGGASTTLDNAVRRMIADGVTTVVAAGNNSKNANIYSPARVSEAITVGASESNDSLARYSNFGSIVDIIAPGTNITSDWYTSDSATKTISGTSMATPHVTGIMALYINANNSLSTWGFVPPDLINSSIVKLSSQAKLALTTSNLIFKPSTL